MNYADRLKSQLQEREENIGFVDVKLPVPALGDDFVFEFKARRVDMTQCIMTGLLPENLALILLDQVQGDKKPSQAKAAEAINNMTIAEQMKFLALQRTIVMQVCADPVIVESKKEAPGEVSIYRLPTELLQALYTYAMEMSGDVPVEMADGPPVTVAEVQSFRPAE